MSFTIAPVRRPRRPASSPAWVEAIRRASPHGRELPAESWHTRRRVILGVLWLNVGALLLFGALTGESALENGSIAGVIAACAALAGWPRRRRQFRSALASLGLLFSSIGLMRLSGGSIELHILLIVMVAVIALFRDWAPFLVALGVVILLHGVGSAYDPSSVDTHPAAIAHPWIWAAIHSGVVLAIGAASLVNRRLNEDAYTRRIAEQEHADRKLRESETHFRSLVQNAADIIAVLDRRGFIHCMSPAHKRVLGDDAGAVVGSAIYDRAHPDDRVKLEHLLRDAAADPGGSRAIEARFSGSDGAWRTLELIATLCAEDPGEIVVNARDISERKSLEDQLIHQAFHDSLTGLANRALFMDRLSHALDRSNRVAAPLAVIYLDFDQFKMINDSLGHSSGDQLLVAMGSRLTGCTRSGDTIARLGGDEFAILLEETGEAGAVELADRIVGQLREPFQLAGHSVYGSASVGIACKESPLESADDLVRNADVAMYVAKQQGKGRAVIYQESMLTKGLERLQLEAELRLAVERNEFVVYYQPILDLSTGRLDEVEALVRWRHPVHGLVMPGAFIPLAEESGLIVPIGIWVLRDACRQARAWQAAQPLERPLGVSVNLSPRMLQHRALVDDVATVLAETGLDPKSLRLEITEGTLVHDGPAAAAVMTRLKRLGVRLAMDDFGTGYSSLSSLQAFPFDILKIDQSFVRALSNGAESVAIVQAIIDLANSLNLTVTGEGIETREQLELLQTLDSHHGQGYLFSLPCPADEMDRYMVEHAAAINRGSARAIEPLAAG